MYIYVCIYYNCCICFSMTVLRTVRTIVTVDSLLGLEWCVWLGGACELSMVFK